MKVYTLQNASSVGNEDEGVFKVDKDGAVVVPEAFGVFLRDNHVNGAKAWEDEIERHARLTAEELERRRDPASLYDAVAKLAASQPAARAPRKAAARKAPAKKAATRKAAPRKPAKKAAKPVAAPPAKGKPGS
jgi:topoisomerase IA-like protein